MIGLKERIDSVKTKIIFKNIIILALISTILLPAALAITHDYNIVPPASPAILSKTNFMNWDQTFTSYVVPIRNCDYWGLNCDPPAYSNHIDATDVVLSYRINGGPVLEKHFGAQVFNISYIISGSGTMYTYDSTIHVTVGENYTFQTCVYDSSGIYCSPWGSKIQIVSNTVSNNPPTANSLYSCEVIDDVLGTLKCYGNNAKFAYDTPAIYPRINFTTYNNNDIRICIYANYTHVGGSKSSSSGCKWVHAGSSNWIGISRLFGLFVADSLAISTQPGDSVTWYATIDDLVNKPILTTSSMNFYVYTTPDMPPVITLRYPADGETFTFGTSGLLLSANVTDIDDSQANLRVNFYLKEPGKSTVLKCANVAASGVNYTCYVNLNNSGRYDWEVRAKDTIDTNEMKSGRYFIRDAVDTGNNLPEVSTLTPAEANVALGDNVSFRANATDADPGDIIYFSYYCQFIPNGISGNAIDDNPNASSPVDWAVSTASPAVYTFSCPDHTKDPSQWQIPGTYWVRVCVTNENLWSNYAHCKDAHVNYMNATSYAVGNLNQTIQFNRCIVGDGCVLNEFYYGMVGFVSGWLIYFMYVFIVFVVALFSYYLYIRVKEGII